MRTIRRASRRTTSIWRASRPHASAQATASGRGSTVRRSTTAPSALDTTFWVTTRTSPSRRGRAPGVASSASPIMRLEVVALADLGQAGERDDLDPAVGLSRQRRPRRRAPRASPRPRRAAGRRACRRRGASTSATSTNARVGRRGEPRVAGPASPPNAGSMTSGGSSSRAFVPRPWRSGASTTLGRAGRVAGGEEGGQGPGADAGQVRRQDEQAVGVDRAARPPGAPGSGRATAARSAARPRPRRRASTSGSGETTTTSVTPSVASAAATVRRSSRSTRSRRSSASRTAPRRDFAPSNARTGMTTTVVRSGSGLHASIVAGRPAFRS